MATCDHPSELVYGIAYPSLQRPGSRKGTPVPVSRAEDKALPAASSSLQGIEAGEVFHSLIASGNLRPRSRWAAVGAVAFQALVLVTLLLLHCIARCRSLSEKRSRCCIYSRQQLGLAVSQSFERRCRCPHMCLQARPFRRHCTRLKKRP